VRSDLVRDEAPWVELAAEVGVVVVRDLLLERGIGDPKAAAIACWLHDQSVRRRAPGPAAAKRAQIYRAELRSIGPAPHPGKVRTIPGYRESLAA